MSHALREREHDHRWIQPTTKPRLSRYWHHKLRTLMYRIPKRSMQADCLRILVTMRNELRPRHHFAAESGGDVREVAAAGVP